MTHTRGRPFRRGAKTVISVMETTMSGIVALQWAKEISKLPNGCFTIAFFPYSRQKGEFDGNWEAMSSDIVFEPDLQRCIGVDVRYMLFIIEKYGKAGNLIKELKIR